MKTIPYFEVDISTFDKSEVLIRNNRTGKPATQNTPSLSRLKKRFKVFLNNAETLSFSHFPQERLDELRNMLPYTKTYPKYEN
jgi:hypothetical protein